MVMERPPVLNLDGTEELKLGVQLAKPGAEPVPPSGVTRVPRMKINAAYWGAGAEFSAWKSVLPLPGGRECEQVQVATASSLGGGSRVGNGPYTTSVATSARSADTLSMS